MVQSYEEFLDFIRRENLCLRYLQVRQGGEVIREYNAIPVKTRLNTWSVSKSFISLAVGMAIDEGLISLDEKIADSFPEYVTEQTSPYLLKATVRDLLTMTSGLEKPLFFCDGPERYTTRDWIAHFFNASFVHEPGTHFLYSNFNTYMLSNLIERKSGEKNTLEYLRWRLFEPIGIGNPDWTLCPMGHIHAANGLYLNIDEYGLFGELVLRKGNWKGRQLVSAAYVEEATRKHVDTPEPMPYGYGYQFWMTQIPGAVAASGNYGQGIIICPEKDAVISFMSLEGNYAPINENAPGILLGL